MAPCVTALAATPAMPVIAVDGRTGDGGKALADAIAAGFREPPFPLG